MNSSKQEMGMAKAMGSQLLNQVGKQLLSDLSNYGISDTESMHISWMESEGEGNWAQYLDGEIENYAYLTVLDANFQAIGQGSMEFILEEDENLLLVYWNSLYFIHPEFKGKFQLGIPDHIWDQIPVSSRKLYEDQRVKKEEPPKMVSI